MLASSLLAKSFGGRTLFEGVSLQLNPGCCYGLVGANGSGKSTLLKVFAGDEPATDGSVSIARQARVGVLRQDRFASDDERILDVAMRGDAAVWAALDEQRRLAAEPAPDAHRLAELEDVIRTFDGYTLEARATEILEGLGIAIAAQKQPLRTLSGGFKLRVLLAQVLLGGPDLLLLDEPTNHLDILSIRWLEKFLAAHRGCRVVISHDVRFLDNVATHVLDVDYGTVTLYTGNYSAFVAEKAAVRERKEAEIARTEKVIAEKRAFVERFGAKATKARQAQSRLKQIEKIEVETLAPSSRRSPLFRFEPERPSGRDVLTLEGIAKSFGDRRVLHDVGVTVRRGDRLAVIGPNGLGKSTLLKIATGRLAPDAGSVAWGHEARVGYFAQDHHDLLTDPAQTPLDFLWNACPKEAVASVRGALGRVLFSGDDVTKRVGALSGGEAARLVFARIIADKPNVLVLDEPTNHLDIEAIEALADALVAFEGTVVLVSHDRWFVSKIATRILELTPQGPRQFPGTYAEYLERCGDDHLDADVAARKARDDRRADTPAPAPTPAPSRGSTHQPASSAATSALSWEEQKRRRNRQKELPARRDAVLAAIEQAEARKQQIVDLYCSPGFFETTAKAEVDELELEQRDLAETIDELMADWESLEAEIAQLEADLKGG